MSSFGTHPGEDLLLRYLDGELAGNQPREILAHLDACPECRADFQAMQAVAADCARYHETVMAENLPTAAWKALDFNSIDAKPASRSLATQVAAWFSASGRRGLAWAVPVAAIAVLGFVAITKLNETPKVEAAALLKKAV